MTVPIWPGDELDDNEFFGMEGFTEAGQDGRLFSEMDEGPPKVRLRTSAAAPAMQASVNIGGGRIARFKRFWQEETNGGVTPFLIKDQLLAGREVETEGAPVLYGGLPLIASAYTLVQFGRDPYTVTPAGGDRYVVSFPLIILP